MERIIMHIDVNNAFLSWTAIDLLEKGYPEDIRKISSIIGGDSSKRRGIVLAKSPVAKLKGIVTAETIYSAKRKDPSLKIFPPNHKMYKKRSDQLFNLLLKYTPDIEIASIDECYLDYTKVKSLYGDEIEFAYKLKEEIKNKLKFTVNIGIANNKLCAKMASDFQKPDKVHTLYSYEVKEKMYPLPIRDLFTVGRKSAEKLENIGIKTIKDLAEQNPYNLKAIFKNNAIRLVEIAQGIDNEEVTSEAFNPKGISNELTLEEDLTEIEDIYKVLEKLSDMVSKRIRKEKKYARVICVILKDNTFKRYSHQKKIKNPTNNYSEILKYSKELLQEFYKNEPIRLVGIRLDDLQEGKTYQISLFEKEPKQDEKVEELMDSINKKYGKELLKRASFIDNENK